MTTTPIPAAGGYSAPAKWLHWIVAISVIALLMGGIGREFMEKGPERDFVTMVHKATGIVVLMMMIARWVWRFVSPPPPPEPGQPKWQTGASHAVHWLLYVIVTVMPVIGWVGSSAAGRPVSMYGLFELPMLTAENKEFAESLFTVHGILGFTALGLVVIHIGAALYHRFVRGDAVLARMT